ncbi:hypothetical protein CISG_08171 [Coccidioides immitis RMSCC 3703]|uniref:Uncharacterized protein n=2 Tax=Coccidioides immitis TaxID=5501 RepID=A0A0J8R5D0_COCIT|nr:hypothetical protein CIRG_00976 [Coccidioides immitis RMSCC 2394]KMU80011.1 hypothetical protein CISG_08171 [Coccidioides immitis RMSCC 3703]
MAFLDIEFLHVQTECWYKKASVEQSPKAARIDCQSTILLQNDCRKFQLRGLASRCDKEITAQQPNQQATPHAHPCFTAASLVSLVIPPCSSPFRSEQSTLLEDANKKKHNPFLLHGDPPLRLPLSSVVN